jgi:cytochrome c553
MKGRRYLFVAVICCALLLSACAADPADGKFGELDLQVADAGSGEKLFYQSNDEAPACTACHAVTGADRGIGNSLDGIAARAGQRVRGQSAAEYLYWSIVQPGRHLAPGYANLMYADYEDNLEAADIADLIAFMLTLE